MHNSSQALVNPIQVNTRHHKNMHTSMSLNMNNLLSSRNMDNLLYREEEWLDQFHIG